MAKKPSRKNRAAAFQPARQAPVSARTGPEGPGTAVAGRNEGGSAVIARALWLSAAVLIVAGYALLHKVDPGGQNGWAIASPALLFFGYLLIIPAIVFTYREE